MQALAFEFLFYNHISDMCLTGTLRSNVREITLRPNVRQITLRPINFELTLIVHKSKYMISQRMPIYHYGAAGSPGVHYRWNSSKCFAALLIKLRNNCFVRGFITSIYNLTQIKDSTMIFNE